MNDNLRAAHEAAHPPLGDDSRVIQPDDVPRCSHGAPAWACNDSHESGVERALRDELAEVKNRLANRTSQHEQALAEARRFERGAAGWRKQWRKDTDRLEDRVEKAEAREAALREGVRALADKWKHHPYLWWVPDMADRLRALLKETQP